MFSDPRFWCGVLIGAALLYGWQRYQAQKAG